MVRRDVLRIEQQPGLQRMAERLGNTRRDQPLHCRRFFLKARTNQLGCTCASRGLDRRDMHFAKALESPEPPPSHRLPSPGGPTLRTTVDPAGLEPVPVPQNEIVFPFHAGSVRPPALVVPTLASPAGAPVGFRQTAGCNRLAIAGSIGLEKMLIGNFLSPQSGRNRLTSWTLREPGSATTSSKNSPLTRPPGGSPSSSPPALEPAALVRDGQRQAERP